MLTLIGLLIILSCIYCVLLRIGKYFIFKPKKKCWPMHLPFKSFSICLNSKECITGVYLPAKINKPTFLFFHGRGGNISHFEIFAALYEKLGYGIILFDYRGFGNSIGKTSQENVFKDAITVARHVLQEFKLLPQNIILYGHSLGNAPALHVATTLEKLHWKGIILQSPFLSAPDMAVSFITHRYPNKSILARFYKWWVSAILYRNQFNNVPFAKKLNIPALICMSKEDKIIPWQMTAKLAEYISHKKIILSPYGGHDDFDWCSQKIEMSFFNEK